MRSFRYRYTTVQLFLEYCIKMENFQNFEPKIKINIFKYIKSPLNLALTCRNWYVIAKDPYAKTEWLIARYGKAHALFNAVRLGPTFIDISVCQTLIARNIVISRCFIQSLLTHFGKYDQRLIEFKMEYDGVHHDTDRIRNSQQSSWASNLPVAVFTYLLDEGYKQLCDVNDSPLKNGDSTSHAINHAPRMPGKNLKDTKNSNSNKRFTPFPPRNLNNSSSVDSVLFPTDHPAVLRQGSSSR
jgi:hypothetical protein